MIIASIGNSIMLPYIKINASKSCCAHGDRVFLLLLLVLLGSGGRATPRSSGPSLMPLLVPHRNCQATRGLFGVQSFYRGSFITWADATSFFQRFPFHVDLLPPPWLQLYVSRLVVCSSRALIEGTWETHHLVLSGWGEGLCLEGFGGSTHTFRAALLGGQEYDLVSRVFEISCRGGVGILIFLFVGAMSLP